MTVLMEGGAFHEIIFPVAMKIGVQSLSHSHLTVVLVGGFVPVAMKLGVQGLSHSHLMVV